VAAAARHARLDPCPSSTAAAAAGGLPDVTLHCLGQAGAATVHLAGLAGRPAVVNVWGSWCPPCREEAPLLQRLHAAAGSRLTVLGVDYEDDDVPALAFTADKALHYPSVADPDGHFPLRRWAAGPPVTFFLDAKGRIVHVQRGPFTSWEQLRTLVDDHLGMSL
jgi:thiol-disulfide isomerase/thioredoxin